MLQSEDSALNTSEPHFSLTSLKKLDEQNISFKGNKKKV
jgi:hypothetical protein